MTYRPTSLSVAAERCPAALDFWEAGEPTDTSIYQPGISAHVVLQECGKATESTGRVLSYEEMQGIARRACEALIERGREFEGRPEPPMAPDRAWAGRDIALDYLAVRPLEPGRPSAQYEAGLAVSGEWEPQPYGGQIVDGRPPPGVLVRTIIDVLRVEDVATEESFGKRVTITDYKSAWPTNADRLGHLQQKIQAVLAWRHFPEADVLVRQVVNLRTRAVYEDEMYLGDPETTDRLEEWQADIESTISALEKMARPRPARPGAGCVGCPYLLQCDDGLDYAKSVDPHHASPEELARMYAVLVALVGAVRDALKPLCSDGPIDIGDGLVGHILREKRQVTEAGRTGMLEAWWPEPPADESRIAGLLRAHGLSVQGVEAALKVLYPADAKERARLIEEWTELVGEARFKVERKAE